MSTSNAQLCLRRSFPAAPSAEELAHSWSLSPADREEILLCRGEANRRRFAVLLCVLRNRGRLLECSERVPLAYLNYLAAQLDMAALFSIDEPLREATESAHRERLLFYLGFSPFDEQHRGLLERWLRTRVEEGVPEAELSRRADALLYSRKVVLPSASLLQRLIAGLTTNAREDLYERIAERIPLHLCRAMDALLEVGDNDPTSRFHRLKQYPPDPLARDMVEYLTRFEELRTLGLDQIDLSGIAVHHVHDLYGLGHAIDANELKRLTVS